MKPIKKSSSCFRKIAPSRLPISPGKLACRSRLAGGVYKIEEAGIIRKRVALLDGPKIGLGMSVFVAIKTDQHNADWLADFAARISAFDEVVEFYRMSGEVDYMLRVVVPNMAAYDAFYKRLISEVSLIDVSSSFAMEEIKYTSALPLN